METIKYIYKVSTYDFPKSWKSNKDMYYAKLEDCLWIYQNRYFNSKTDDLDERYYSHTPPPRLNDFFDIQVIRVLDSDDRYKSAIYNSEKKITN